MPNISVIVPVYKVESYLRRCIDSILNQTYTDFELILVDDGSPDNCGAICDEYAHRDNRVVVIHQKNSGVSAARNAGLDISKGDYLSFVDSDDYIYPQYLDKLYSHLVVQEADISICKTIHFSNEIPEKQESASVGNIYDRIEVCSMLCDYRKAIGIVEPWGKLYKKKFFDNVRFPVGRIHEDQFVAHKIMYASEKTVIIEDQLYGYFHNPDGITKHFSIKRYDNALALKEAGEFYLKNGEQELAEKADKLKQLVIAFYTVSAVKNRVYRDVPKEYRMGILAACREIRRQMGYDYYEWYMAGQAPLLTKILAKIRSLFRISST